MNEREIKKALLEHYNMQKVALTKMAGYESTNYRVETNHSKWVLKIYDKEEPALFYAREENTIMKLLQQHNDSFPKPVTNNSGEAFTNIDDHGKVMRMLTFLEGAFLAEVDHTDHLIKSFGRFLGRMSQKLAQVRNPIIESKHTIWDLDHFLENGALCYFIKNASERKIVEYFLIEWKTFVLDRLPNLRKSIIHNDANEWNVLTSNGEVSGLIDFGDMVYSRQIYELAIAANYLAIDKADPVKAISILVSAYHQEFPLYKEEVELLYYLVAARLCTSVLNSAKGKVENPENTYIAISEQGSWKLLKKWITINPLYARNEFLKAIGHGRATPSSVLSTRNKLIPEVLSLSYREPIHMVRSAFQYMYDQQGNAILDAYNNIIHVGHCHPHVVSAGQKALAKLNTNTRYLYPELTEYAAHLLSYFPDKLNKVFLVNSGSAAGDLAIRLARTYTGRKDIAVMEHGYHGNSSLGIDVSHYKYGHKGGEGRKEHVIQLEMPDTYRGRFQDDDAGSMYAGATKETLQLHGEETIAAFIAEPIIGCGGQVPLAKGYLKRVYESVRAAGGLCISDEVQTGFGRLGRWFWGFEMHEVIPDIVVLGKPIGNGHPMAAVVTTSAIATAFNNGMEFFSSFGGNPVSCAIGKAVLEVIEKEDLQNHSMVCGDLLMDELKYLQTKFDVIGDVRGAGYFIGVDLVSDRENKAAHTSLAADVVNDLKEMNILTSLDGPGENVIKIKPPLCFNENNVNTLVSALNQVLSKFS